MTLDPEIRKLLESERDTPRAPADVRARVMARARASLAQPAAQPPQLARHRAVRFAAAAGLLLAVTAGAIAGIRVWTASAPPSPTETQPSRLALAPQPNAVAAAPEVLPPEVATEPGAKAAPRPRGASDVYAAEIALLRQAQDEAAHGRWEASLSALAEPARRFPTARLAEEREALRIKALSKLGRTADACRAAERFRTRFPRSVLLSRVNQI